jgi:23S rRNA (adenine2503-C2)-methyltransferase
MLPHELSSYFKAIGEKEYRGKQVFSWLQNGVSSFDEMTNLSIELRNKLDNYFYITTSLIEEKLISQSDNTIKYLWRLSDDSMIESVLMEYEFGLSICISTQVGCRMGCIFCASGIDGLERNLSPSEMLDQVLYTQTDIGKRISNIVLMGIGEPLDNFDNVVRFLELITHQEGLNIGARHITLSTCGMTENIDKLADYGIQLTLAISLHAPDDTTREWLMQKKKKYKINDILDAGNNYYKKTGRRVTYEYAFINGINDSLEQAQKLSDLLKNTNSHLNLMYLNNFRNSDLHPSSKSKTAEFTDCLKLNGINFTVRRTLGSDIAASCGLLRRRNKRVSGDI